MNQTSGSLTRHFNCVPTESLMRPGLTLIVGILAIVIAAEGRRGDERNWLFWWHAHQLFGCEPEQLSESQSHDVERWCRCLAIAAKFGVRGTQSVTDEECREVVETLDALSPRLVDQRGYLRIYDACRQRLVLCST